jgi:pimeloyl-ACP methyl ester carboxylesterase
VVNYRGYGGSPGKPSQRALYDDALAIYDFAVQSGAEPANLFVMGRSLGSAMAVWVASQRTTAGAILVTPFDSMASVGARHYPFVPVRLLLRHPFPSDKWAQGTRAPAIMIAAANDYVVPPVHAVRLHDAWAGPKSLHTLEGVGHNDIELHPEYYALINAFISERVGPAQPPANK